MKRDFSIQSLSLWESFREQRKPGFSLWFFLILYCSLSLLFCIESISLNPLGHHCPVTALRLDKNGSFLGESSKWTHSLDLFIMVAQDFAKM